jgi:hypothetical protein
LVKGLHQDESQEIVCKELEEIFCERGSPCELLMDNGKSFRSQLLLSLCSKWSVKPMYRCAYKPQGNGIVERNHRTIKRMAARTGGNVLEMVHYYNFSPKEGQKEMTAPCAQVFTYPWRCPGMVVADSCDDNNEQLHDLPVGTKVFVKPPDGKCTSEWRLATVSGPGGVLSVEVDGIPRHVSDVRVAEVANGVEKLVAEYVGTGVDICEELAAESVGTDEEIRKGRPKQYGFAFADCHGQSYDNADNMAGKYSGVR